MTTYLVLRLEELAPDKKGWKFVKTLDAPSARAAIKATATEPGEYAAIPQRSWKPVKVTVDTNPTVKLTDA